MVNTISAIARQAGVSPDTLRYYERLGLVAPAQRMANGYRSYDPEVVDRVRLIKGAQRTGLRLDDIKELLEISDRGACPCGHTRTLLQQRISHVEHELDRLRQVRRQLIEMLAGLDDCAEQPTGTWWCETEFIAKGGEPR